MAEIEHFVDPSDKTHAKFSRVADYELSLLSANNQMSGQPAQTVAIGKAVSSGLVANETLGYFMARVAQFLLRVGVDPRRLRFRQHMSNEMAHYACDCWDAECLTSYGWVECVGNADRSCYDLQQHAKATGNRLVAEKALAEPVTVTQLQAVFIKAKIGQTFKQKAKLVTDALAALSEDELKEVQKQLQSNKKTSVKGANGEAFELTEEMVQVKEVTKQMHVHEFVPSVIEPSFGIGRILYSVFEHNFRCRDGDQARQYLCLPPIIAPIKCSVLPLSNHDSLKPLLQGVCDDLMLHEVSHRVDNSSAAIGRRYARTDEVGIPFGITIDFDSVACEPMTVTVRERDSMQQIRVPVTDVGQLLRDLSRESKSWQDAQVEFPAFSEQQNAPTA